MRRAATPGRIERYTFDSFTFTARRIAKGHRLRLAFGPADSPGNQKNYNSGGDVSDETAKDARTLHVPIAKANGSWPADGSFQS